MMHDIDPMDIDPETNRPYANYSSPSLDTSFHDAEMAVDDPIDEAMSRLELAAAQAGIFMPDTLCDLVRAELKRRG